MTRIDFICTSFHREHIERMLASAQERCEQLGLEVGEVFWVPGCYEVPYALRELDDAGGFDGIVVLGIIERGETEHGAVMGQVVGEVLTRFQIRNRIPIGVGIIGPGAEPEHIEPRLVPHATAAVEAVDHMLKGPAHWRGADE